MSDHPPSDHPPSDHLLSDHLLSDHLLSDHLLSDYSLSDHPWQCMSNYPPARRNHPEGLPACHFLFTTMKNFMLIYDAFEESHYGVFDRTSGERLAGIVVTPTPTGDTFQGSINGRHEHAREWESLDEFAERLYRLSLPPEPAPVEERLSLGLFD